MKKLGAINILWAVLAISGIICAAANGNIDLVTEGALDAGAKAVNTCIGLAGVMCVWMGLMKIADISGLVKAAVKAVRPVLRLIFKDIPGDHPAMGAMAMNITANILGLGNAATPFGLKAMKELQKLNEKKDTATNNMITFLAINTSSITVIPSTVIALRSAAGSEFPSAIVGPVIAASMAGTIFAILMCKLLCRREKP